MAKLDATIQLVIDSPEPFHVIRAEIGKKLERGFDLCIDIQKCSIVITRPQKGGRMNERVARLKQWKGIPIPFFVTWRTDGVPDFKVVNETNRARCAKEKLCWVCGETLGYWIVFIGGPKSAASRYYLDGPMHEECARDALAICPFLLGRMDYAKHLDTDKHSFRINMMPSAAPENLILFKTRSFTIERAQGTWLFFAAPAFRLETIQRRSH